MSFHENRPYVASEQPEHIRPYIGLRPAVASFPPAVHSLSALGYVKDVSNTGYSRDIGRSSMLRGRLYYLFGDTFVNNHRGDFIGIQSSTAAIVSNPSHPMIGKYLNLQENEMVDALIPLTENEQALERKNWEDGSAPRVTLWAFGGMVQVLNLGWLWFQKAVINEDEGKGESKYKGTGLARISVNNDGSLSTFRVNSDQPLMFGEKEPRIGTFSSIVEGEFIYLWGDHAAGYQQGVILSRVRKDSFQTKSKYTYWNGETYVDTWKEAKFVFMNMQSGSIFKSNLFGEARPWVFVGCTFGGTCEVIMGAAATLEGPFNEISIFTATGIDYPKTIMYCVYPHNWAYDESQGELMVTWSEQWPGGVVGAKISLKMDPEH